MHDVTDITETVRRELQQLIHGKPAPKRHTIAWTAGGVLAALIAGLVWQIVRVPSALRIPDNAPPG